MWSYSFTTSTLQFAYAACHIFAPFPQSSLQSTEKEKKATKMTYHMLAMMQFFSG